MKNNTKRCLILSLISLIVFFLILLNLNNFSAIDNKINLTFSSLKNNFLISISKAIAWIFEPVIVIIYALIISLMLFIKKYKKDSAIFGVSVLAGGGFIYLVKEIVQRTRPENALVLETNSSFPSGHALISVVFFGFFIYFASKYIQCKSLKTAISVSLILLMFIVGLSRLVLSVHWFSDVLGGWFLGLFLFLGFQAIANIISN